MSRVLIALLGLAFTLTSPAADFMPRAGLWFNPDRDGHGLDLEFSSENLAVAWYTYRVDGTPIWYLASGPWAGHDWQASLSEFHWDGNTAAGSAVGSIALHFDDQESARLDYTLGTISGSESLIFLRFGPRTAPAVDPTGLWFHAQQSGWGLSIAGQGETVVAVSYFYDQQGNPSWAIANGNPGLGVALPMLALNTQGLCPGCSGTPVQNISSAGSLTLTAQPDGRLQLDMDATFASTVWQRDAVLLDSLTTPLPQQSERLKPPLVDTYPIDGTVDFTKLDPPVSVPYQWTGSASKTDPSGGVLRWAKLQSDRKLYLAVEWDDPSEDGVFDVNTGTIPLLDGMQILIDSDANGVLEDGEDARFLIDVSQGSSYIDQHVASNDNATDAVSDGLGRIAYHANTGKYQAEFLLPVAGDMNGEDGLAGNFNLKLFDRVNTSTGAGRIANIYGDDASIWPELALPQATVVTHDHAEIPPNLPGTIVFISNDAGEQGEIYRFVPATGLVEQVTDMPGLFKDNVSLSHDRTRAAFHGSPDKAAFSQYEIYVLDLDSKALTRITNNNILDGHPAWSPDDQRLAFASFRDAGAGASVVITDLAGTEIIDLTPSGSDDNDPDFLPDGRLVIKTDRFQPQPNIDIAVINADGSGLTRVTSLADASDHDAVGDDQFAVFERFPLGTDFSTDPRALFTSWELVQARLDGSAERRLLVDSFVNWLPVYSPDGLYVAYQKTVGYTDLRLMTRAGRRIGRLIPNHSEIRYTDWK